MLCGLGCEARVKSSDSAGELALATTAVLGGAPEKVGAKHDRDEASVAAPGGVEPMGTTCAASRLGGGRPTARASLRVAERVATRPDVATF
jgi:hypothetical protein